MPQPDAVPYEKILSVEVRSPHATWTSMDIGSISILFSYGQPFGIARAGTVFVRPDFSRATSRHLNKWRDFRLQKKLTTEQFEHMLVGLLLQEIQTIAGSINFQGVPTVSEHTEAQIDAEAPDFTDPAALEVEGLDEIAEDEDNEDIDDDDFDDDDSDDDDDDDDDIDLDFDDDDDDGEGPE